jgi:predicted transposase YdaD
MGNSAMSELRSSVTYQAIVEEGRAEGRTEGRAEGIRAALLRLGRVKFGRGPTRKQQAKLDAMTDPARLESLIERAVQVNSWGELLNGR